MSRRIVFHVGGPRFHPVDQQARMIESWLGAGYQCEQYDGVDAFDHLADCDLLVLMGLHWTGMTAEWAGGLPYRPMLKKHQAALEAYVRSGRPVLVHHGAVASYDDWPRFGELVGVAWIWGKSEHSPEGVYTVVTRNTGHAVIKNVSDYTLYDELYFALTYAPGLEATVHASANWKGEDRAMVVTAEGGRAPGAGRMVFLANGHDLRAFGCVAMRRLWVNAVEWLTKG